LHSNAIQKIENKVKGSLQNCQIKDNWPQYESFAVHVESLSKEILQHKKEWLNMSDVFSIFYNLIYQVVNENTEEGKTQEGNLWDILGEEKGLNLTESIKNYLLSIPRSYDVYIPIAKVSENILTSVQLSENISLHVFEEAEQIPGEYQSGLFNFGNKLEINTVYFRQRPTGYCGNRLESVSLKKAISNFKILLQQGIFRKLFKVAPSGKTNLGLLSGLNYHQVPKARVTSVDQTSESPKLVDVELPLDFSKFLDKIDFNWEGNHLTRAKESGKTEQAIAAILKKAIELIECEAEESRRVKSAIEWRFNSDTVENQTLAFLQVCIGLEALLGDDKTKDNLTETLADRCSYLISSDIKGRKTIKKQFKVLYDVRSKLVHGNVTELDSHQKESLGWGKIILEYAILKEIKHLNLGKT